MTRAAGEGKKRTTHAAERQAADGQRGSEEALRNLRQLGSVLECPDRVRFCQQGNPATQVFLLEMGLITIGVAEEDGSEYYAAYRTPGWLLGAASAITAKPYPASLVAHTPATKVRAIAGRDFLLLLKEDVTVSSYVHQLHAYELHEQISKLSSLALHNACQRLEEFLWQILPHVPSTNGKFQLPFSDVEIARFVATTPQHLSGAWRDLEAKRIVQRARGWLVVPDRDRLWHNRQTDGTASTALLAAIAREGSFS